MIEICETPRRASSRHRAGRGPDGGDERERGQRSTRRSLPAVEGFGHRPRSPADPSSRSRVVVRPADRRRARSAAHHVGVRRRLRPRERLSPSSTATTRWMSSNTSTRSSASRSSSRTTPTTRTRYGLFETIRQFAEDRLAEAGALEATRDRHAAHFAREAAARWERWDGPGWRDAVDWVELELANLRAGFRWSAARGELDVATDIAAHAALMGFSVQLFETLAWAEELLDAATAADVRRLPRLYTGRRLRVLRRTGRGRRVQTRTARPSSKSTPRYEPCEPGYATFVEALGAGLLRRPRSLRRAHRCGGSPLRQRARATASRPTSTAFSRRSSRGGARADRGVGRGRARRSAIRTGSSYALWIAGMAFSKADARRALAAWDEGVAFVREHRVHFFEGFLARDAARLHTSDGEPEAALVLFAEAHRRVPARGQRPAADHHAGQRAGAVRTPRSTRAGGHAARRDGARAVELPSRARARRSRRSARRTARARSAPRELTAGGRGARPQRRPPCTHGSRSTSPAATRARPRSQTRPGRPEPAGGRGAAARRRRQDRGRDRRRSCSSRPGPPSTTSSTSTRRSASPAAPPRPAGRSSTGVVDVRRLTADRRPTRYRAEMGRSTDAARGAPIRRMTPRRPTRSADARSTAIQRKGQP